MPGFPATTERMTTDAVSAYLSRSPGAIRNLVNRRRIPFRRVGGRLLFLRSEIDRWIDEAPGVRPEDLLRP
jgi:excisionase family DNA binding protein